MRARRRRFRHRLLDGSVTLSAPSSSRRTAIAASPSRSWHDWVKPLAIVKAAAVRGARASNAEQRERGAAAGQKSRSANTVVRYWIETSGIPVTTGIASVSESGTIPIRVPGICDSGHTKASGRTSAKAPRAPSFVDVRWDDQQRPARRNARAQSSPGEVVIEVRARDRASARSRCCRRRAGRARSWLHRAERRARDRCGDRCWPRRPERAPA